MTKKTNRSKGSTSDESQQILERVQQESETVGTSSLSRVADRVKNHMSAGDSDPDDAVEVWGTRIGRGLGLVFFIFLALYLIQTYLLNG